MTADLSTLCRACGLCCDGTLFTSVRLAADEPARMRSHGLVVIRGDGGESISQRCGALAPTDRDCAIYPDRPAQCAGFECLLVAALRAGELSTADAHAVVDEARRRVLARSPDTAEFLRRHFLGRVAAPR